MPTGEIEPRQAERLREMGAVAGDARRERLRHARRTMEARALGRLDPEGAAVYVHVLEWPADTLVLPTIERRVVEASVLGGGRAEARATGAGLELRVAPSARQSIDTVVKLQLDGPAQGLAAR